MRWWSYAKSEAGRGWESENEAGKDKVGLVDTLSTLQQVLSCKLE